MLNKLLKRCMPWMDKGRWYHLWVSADAIKCDDIFDNPTNIGMAWKVPFRSNFSGQIADSKMTMDFVYDPGDPPISHVVEYRDSHFTLKYNEETGPYLFIPLPYEDETFNIWIFIRPVQVIESREG